MGACLTPYRKREQNGQPEVNVPCGKCYDCCMRRASGWSFRLMQESKKSVYSHFITLTYATEHVPITGNGFMSFNKRDTQLFWKRLRKQVSQFWAAYQEKNKIILKDVPPVRYYLAAEYGGKTRRPHYHAIVFNVPDPYCIERSWGLGTVWYGSVSAASVGYCLKYISKPRTSRRHQRDDRVMEFGTFSKGLGLGYLTDQVRAWHKADLDGRMYLVYEGGKRCAMPRYYKQKLYTCDERAFIAIGAAKRALDNQNKLIRKLGSADEYDAYVSRVVTARLEKLHKNLKKDRL